jgi:hypothetical protein
LTLHGFTYLAVENIIGNFTTSKETFMTDDGVDGEVGLRQPNLVRCTVTDLQLITTQLTLIRFAYLEDIQRGNGVDVGLLVGSVNLGGLLVDGRKEGGQDFQLQALCKRKKKILRISHVY